MRMSNLIRGSEDESGGPATAAHSRTQERYYEIISRTDRSGLAQSEFASGDLSQTDKHLLLPEGHSSVQYVSSFNDAKDDETAFRH